MDVESILKQFEGAKDVVRTWFTVITSGSQAFQRIDLETYLEYLILGFALYGLSFDENKATRPQAVAESASATARIGGTNSEAARPSRRRLPDERLAITHHFSIAGHEGYLTVGLYEDSSPGEIFREFQENIDVICLGLDFAVDKVSDVDLYGCERSDVWICL